MNFEKFFKMIRGAHWIIVLAAMVEIPRWWVAFKAIHEPAMFGVPLAAIITFSMSASWELYFRIKGTFLLMLNILSLIVSTIIIAPVIYLLTQSNSFTVVLSEFSWQLRLVWSLALTLATFLPLITFAAVRSYKEEKEPAPAPVPVSEVSVPKTETSLEVKEHKVSRSKSLLRKENAMEQPTEEISDERKKVAWQMLQNGVKQSQVASHFMVTPRTVRNWVKDIQIT